MPRWPGLPAVLTGAALILAAPAAFVAAVGSGDEATRADRDCTCVTDCGDLALPEPGPAVIDLPGVLTVPPSPELWLWTRIPLPPEERIVWHGEVIVSERDVLASWRWSDLPPGRKALELQTGSAAEPTVTRLQLFVDRGWTLPAPARIVDARFFDLSEFCCGCSHVSCPPMRVVLDRRVIGLERVEKTYREPGRIPVDTGTDGHPFFRVWHEDRWSAPAGPLLAVDADGTRRPLEGPLTDLMALDVALQDLLVGLDDSAARPAPSSRWPARGLVGAALVAVLGMAQLLGRRLRRPPIAP